MRELIAAILKSTPPYPLTGEGERILAEREILKNAPTEDDCAFEWPQGPEERSRESKRLQSSHRRALLMELVDE